MEWLLADPLPEECQHCAEGSCYDRDHAGKRWILPKEDGSRTDRMMMERAKAHLQRKLDAQNSDGSPS